MSVNTTFEESQQITKYLQFPRKNYFTDQEAENMKNYKLRGADFGLVYTYFYSPLADQLIKKTPTWVAPNLLTLTGFFMCVFPIIVLYCCMGPSLIGELPTWFIALQAVCMFSYRILDEMDGKQARKTQNGSPLGMVFDHGVDCFAIGLQFLTFGRLLQIGDNFLMKLLLLVAYQSFHFLTLENYYIGELVLGRINGVSEGSFTAILIWLFSAKVGNEFWTQPLCDGRWLHISGIEDLTYGQGVIFVALAVTGKMSVESFFKVLWTCWYPKQNQARQPKLRTLLVQYSAFYVWAAVWLICAELGNDPIKF